MQAQDTLLLRSLNICQLLLQILVLRDSGTALSWALQSSGNLLSFQAAPQSMCLCLSLPERGSFFSLWGSYFCLCAGFTFLQVRLSPRLRKGDSLLNRNYYTPQAQKYVRRWNWHTQSDPKLVFPGTIMRENLNSPILARCHRREDVYERKSKSLIATLADNPRQVAKLHEGP